MHKYRLPGAVDAGAFGDAAQSGVRCMLPAAGHAPAASQHAYNVDAEQTGRRWAGTWRSV